MKLRLAILLMMNSGLLATSHSAWAVTVFSENFNNPTGQGSASSQATTGLSVYPNADYVTDSVWMKQGTSVANIVDRGGADSFALMLYQGAGLNVLTSASTPGGNVLGQHYVINFDVAPAVYSGLSQATDDAQPDYTDGVYVEVLDSANAVMAIQLFKPGSFASQAGAGSLPFKPVSMTYIGTGVGSGEVSLRLSANNAGSNRFGGAVDNLTLNTALFTENFNEPTGSFNNIQFTTGLNVAHSGNLTNWSEAGSGAIHLVQRTPGAPSTGNRAAMFYNGGAMNQIQSIAIPGGNTLGYGYQVAFELAPGDYDSESQATTATDAMVLQLVDSLNQVVATGTFFPGAFADSAELGNLAFAPIVFNYNGTGSGDGSISIRLLPNFEGSNKFAGSIDNLVLSVVSVPEPSALVLGLVSFVALLRRRRLR